ncbi:MAG: lysozyme inhibitor LprI family protein [Prosthecobacter sp.]
MRAITFPAILLLFSFLTLGASLAQDALTPRQARAKFEKADKALNEAWAAAKAKLPEAEFNKLKDSQRAWVEYRDYLARSPLYSGADSQGELALDSAEYLSAAAELEDMRTEWLQALVEEKPEDETLTGVWTDSYGGTLQVVEREGELFFIIECVRGPTSHIGGLSGVAAWNQTIGWYSDKGVDKEKEEVTSLSFTMRDNQLEIIGANTGHYHGARAYFDGSYVKTGALNTKAQAKVVKAAKSGELQEE